jgi:hypothetical protein
MNMENYFLSKVKYTKQIDDGTFKRVTESFLYPVQSFTEAELATYGDVGSCARGEFVICSISPYRVDFMMVDEDEIGGPYYRATLTQEIDDDNGKTKKIKLYALTNAKTMEQAHDRFAGLITTNVSISSISEAKIEEYVPNPQMAIYGEPESESL